MYLIAIYGGNIRLILPILMCVRPRDTCECYVLLVVVD